MSYIQQYVELDGKYHALAEDTNYTVCGKDVPYNSTYAPLGADQEAHCGPDAKPKGKKGKDGDAA